MKMHNKFNNIRIKNKILLMYIFGIVIPLLIVFSFFLNGIFNEIKNRESLALNSAMSRVENNLLSMIDEMIQVGKYFIADDDLSSLLETDDSDTKYDVFVDFKAAENRINVIKWAFPEINSIVLYHSREDFADGSYLVYLSDKLKDEDWYINYQDIKYAFLFQTEFDSKDMHLVMVSNLSNSLDKTTNLIKQDILPSTISTKLQDDYFQSLNDVYLINPDNEIIASNNDIYESFDEIQVFDFDGLKENQSAYVINLDHRQLEDGWKIVFLIEEQNILDRLGGSLAFLLLAMLIVFSLSYFFIHLISNSISQRLSDVAIVMSKSEIGLLTKLHDDSSNDEIGRVSHAYNHMIDRLQNLLNELRLSKEHSDLLLAEKVNAYEELEAANEEMEETNIKLANVNQELTASFEEIKIQDIRIHELIYSDLLTGLNNRFSIIGIIEASLKEETDIGDTSNQKAIIFVDVDNFKYINDTYGHDTGDIVIKKTGEKLLKFEDKHINIGRFGGDEFIIFSPVNAGKTDIVLLLEHIKEAFESPIEVEDKRFYLTISMGVSVFPDNGNNRNELIKKADMALYKSKNTGKNKYTFYDAAFDSGLERKILLQTAIKDAIKNKEFYLNYQPYVNARTGKLKGYEALIRWKSPSLGQVSPFELITVAEEMGVIVEIGYWIIEEALNFIKEVNAGIDDKKMISVNISALQLKSKDFVERLLGLVKAVGVNIQEICLEMTETVLIDSYSMSKKDLHTLQGYGFGIALDDFGTGYSSLSYFKELPVTVLKIDKAFIDEISSSKFNRNLVHVMKVIAHTKGIELTAEGVETREQLEILQELNCDTIQGYYFSKPLDKEKALQFLRDN